MSIHTVNRFNLIIFLFYSLYICLKNPALAITHAFPCRNSKRDRQNAAEVELEIQRSMLMQNLSLVGWYHSHPKWVAQPTLRDCDAQLDYQIKMRGASEATYSPCVGMICCKATILFIIN